MFNLLKAVIKILFTVLSDNFMTTKKSNLDYNVQEKKPSFNTRKTFCQTARQIENDCATKEQIIADLIRVTRENLEGKN